jgi:hypothetical protein
MRTSYRAIGHRLRVARITLGLTEQDVARVVGITLSGRRCESSTIGPGQNLSSARVEP